MYLKDKMKIDICKYGLPAQRFNHSFIISFGDYENLINIYTLILVCAEADNLRVTFETTHFSQKNLLNVRAFIYQSTE